MKHRVGAFDVWVYRECEGAVRYLLLHTSQAKADRWFNGGRFWQIPSDFTAEDEDLASAAARCLASFGIQASAVWAVEQTYTIYNRRYGELQTIVVLAASVAETQEIQLMWEHSEYRWCTAAECGQLLGFRGLQEGLAWTRKCITEVSNPLPELRLL